MNLPERSNEIVPAKYCEMRIPAYRDNLYIRALGDILSREQVEKKIIRKPTYLPECRKWASEDRVHLLPDIDGIVTPLSCNFRFEQMFSILIRQGYRNRWGDAFWKRVHDVEKISPKMLKLASKGQIVGSTMCALVRSITGIGKTTMTGTTMQLYRDGTYEHSALGGGKGINHLQVPILAHECPWDASVSAIIEHLFVKLGNLVHDDLLRDVKVTSAAKMLPLLVEKLLEYSVGMLIIDEAQVVASRFSGGDRTLLYFWINLMNAAGIPLLLLANPEILDITGDFAKAGMRFCSGGEMVLHEYPRFGEWQVLVKSAWPYQYTLNETKLTIGLADAFHRRSGGIPRAFLMLYRFTQQLAIDEGGDEILTPDLVNRAADLNMDSLRRIIDGLILNTDESRMVAIDLGPARPVKTELPKIDPPTPTKPKPDNDDAGRVDPNPGAIPKPRPKAPPKRGKVEPAGLVSYLDEKVRGKLSVFAALQQDGIVKRATEFL